MIFRPLFHEDDMEEDRQDLQQRPTGAKRAHLIVAASLLPALFYLAFVLGWLQ